MVGNVFIELLHHMSREIKLAHFQAQWKKNNFHNKTMPVSLFQADCVQIGKGTYGNIDVHTFGNPDEKLIIGNYCSITNGCSFILGGEHNYKCCSTFPFYNYFEIKALSEAETKGPIIIEDDVWIGYGCIVLSGVHIGKGAVIGAGSIVTQNIPPYAIAAGNPAKVIRYRFSEKIIKQLKNAQGTTLMITKEKLYWLEKTLTEENVSEVISHIYQYDEHL